MVKRPYRGAVLCSILVLGALLTPGPGGIREAAAEEKTTMELFVPSAPGGSRDVYARIMARYMPRHLPGNPSIIVKNMPGAGGDIMLNHMYVRAKKDGSTFATATNAMYRAERLGLESARYDLRKFNFLGAMPESPYLVVIRGDHPIKSYQDLLTAKKPAFYGMTTATGGGSTELVGHALKDEMGAQMKFVSGYRGSARRVAAVLRGELDITLDRLSTSEEYLKEGKLRIVLVLTHADRIPPELLGDAPEWFKLEMTREMRELSDFVVTPTDLDKTYVASPGVPAERVRQMRDAFNKVLEEPEVKKILKERGAVSPAIRGEVLEKEVVPRLLGVSRSTVATVKKWLGR